MNNIWKLDSNTRHKQQHTNRTERGDNDPISTHLLLLRHFRKLWVTLHFTALQQRLHKRVFLSCALYLWSCRSGRCPVYLNDATSHLTSPTKFLAEPYLLPKNDIYASSWWCGTTSPYRNNLYDGGTPHWKLAIFTMYLLHRHKQHQV